MNEKTRGEWVEEYALAQVGGPYIFGGTAAKCTPAYRKARMAQYPAYAEKMTRYCPVLSGKQAACTGCKWDGMIAHDCAQLTKWAADAGGYALPSGATSQWKSSVWALKGTIDTVPEGKTCSLFVDKDGTKSHTGLLLRDGRVVDARGHEKGVLLSGSIQSSGVKWTHWAMLPDLEAKTNGKPVKTETVKNGSKGASVLYMQQLLSDIGYTIAADGVFGNDTAAVVVAFQRDKGLTADGICGPKTWAALEAAAEETHRVDEQLEQQLMQDLGGEKISAPQEESETAPAPAPAVCMVLLIPGEKKTLEAIQAQYGGVLTALPLTDGR